VDTLVELLGHRDMAAELGQPVWKDEDYRRQHIEDVQEVLSFWTCQQDREDLFRLGQDMRFPWAPVASIADVLHDPQLRARRFFLPASHPLAERGFEAPRPVLYNCVGTGLKIRPLRGAPEDAFHKVIRNNRGMGFQTRSLRPHQNICRCMVYACWISPGCWPGLCHTLLADFGAEVIKVQSRQTATGAEDNQSRYFAT
jgi:crotonobetainyl-CoA:carnitine CoA-transferase CaiB-like acyl-CoA transferase